MTALGLHLVGAALWVGGLVMLVLLRGVLPGDRLAAVVARYSSIALGCFVLVAVSGTASAQIRVGALSNLFTPYGTLVLVKIGAIVAIGVLGAVQRRRVIRALTTSPDRQRPFWTLIVVELAVMGVASGFAAALGRTATPVDQIALSKTTDPSPAELLTDDLLPHAPGAWGWLTQWNIDLFWLMAAVLLAATYVAASCDCGGAAFGGRRVARSPRPWRSCPWWSRPRARCTSTTGSSSRRTSVPTYCSAWWSPPWCGRRHPSR